MKKHLPTSNTSKGFTLVELLITVTIIAVLAMIGVTVFGNVQRDGRNSRRRGDVQAISKAVEVNVNKSANQNCTGVGGTYCAPLGSWFAAGVVPTDPGTGALYAGTPLNGATTYNICATLEPASAGTYCQSDQQGH